LSTVKTNLRSFLVGLTLIFKLLWFFMAGMMPLLLLVGVISSIDQVSQHRRLLENLQAYGVATSGNLSYVNLDGGMAGVDFVRPDGSVGYGSLDLRYYPDSVSESLKRGQVLQIYYIDALVSGGDVVVLAEYYDHVQAYAPISREVWSVFGVAFLMILITPHFLFLGMADFDKLFPNFNLPEKSQQPR
jgi:hypothetical protein